MTRIPDIFLYVCFEEIHKTGCSGDITFSAERCAENCMHMQFTTESANSPSKNISPYLINNNQTFIVGSRGASQLGGIF